jgi:hypothetical protein
MSAESDKAKSRRRWRRSLAVACLIALSLLAYTAWSNYRWFDPRFVGAWRVINSKSDFQSIYVLHADGRGTRLELTSNRWWIRGSAAPYRWSIGRDGFLFDNLDTPASQFGNYVVSLGGLLNQGRLTWPRFARNRDLEIMSIEPDRIRLIDRQEGILIPLELTLERMNPADVPPASF